MPAVAFIDFKRKLRLGFGLRLQFNPHPFHLEIIMKSALPVDAITPATKITSLAPVVRKKAGPYKAYSVYVREDNVSRRFAGRVATLTAVLRLAAKASLKHEKAEIRHGMNPIGIFKKGRQEGPLLHV